MLSFSRKNKMSLSDNNVATSIGVFSSGYANFRSLSTVIANQLFFLLLLCLLSSFFVSAVADEAQPGSAPIIDDIRVEGLERVSAELVFAALPVNVGQRITPSLAASAINSVFSTGNFKDIEIGFDNGLLIIKVEERPSISEITLEGNKAIETEALMDGLRNQGMAEGRVFQRSTLEGMKRELARQYGSQGRYDAVITTDVTPEPRNRVAVDITIDEGDSSRIKRISIIGNDTYDDEELRDLMELKDRGWFSFITGGKKYSKEKLSGDLDNIKDFYLDRGYAQFAMESALVSLSPQKDAVYIDIAINEGERYTIDEVNLSGDVRDYAGLLERSFLIWPGQTFSQAQITATEELFKRLMGNYGYAFAEAKGITEINDETKKVDLTFLVEPGKKTYVRRIEFAGNRRTNDDVLRREMRQMEGGLASTELIEASRVRLERLGFFKEVTVDNPPVPGTDDLVDVKFDVEEQAFGSISASLGFSQDVGLIFGLNFQQNNFLGTGRSVSMQANRSRYRTQYGLSYVNPYFTPDGVSRGFSVFFRETDFDEVNITSYSTNSVGGSVNFGYPLSETQAVNFSFGYTRTEIETGFAAVQEIVFSPTRNTPSVEIGTTRFVDRDDPDITIVGNTVMVGSQADLGITTEDLLVIEEPGFVDRHGTKFGLFNVGLSWRESTLNRGVFATRGHSNSLNFEASVPGSELEFFKLSYKNQYFFPLTRSLTLRLRSELGYGDGFGDTDRLPFFEHYFAGGIGSVRGYETNTLGPRSSDARSYTPYFAQQTGSFLEPILVASDQDGRLTLETAEIFSGDPDPFGGNILFEGSAEVIFPIPFVKDQRSLRTVLFYDTGNVFDSDCRSTQLGCTSFDLGELRSSVGLSLTWLSGFGPLAFSIGKPIGDDGLDETEFFQFTLSGGGF